jgi:succinate dehydrogenase flavin-adding protein (antitoxin of CptAB toxin-antitoxin module)
VPTALNLKNFTGHNQCIRSLSFNSEGTKIVSGGYDQFIKLWDIASGKEIFSVKASAFPIEVLSFTPDDRYIITAGLENNVKIWDAENGKLVRILKGHTDAVYALTVSSDSRYLATGGNDNIIRIWEIQTGILLYQLKAHTQGIRSLVFSPDGRYLISGGVEGKIYIWNTEKLNIKPGVTQKELVYNNPMDINIATPLQNPYISSKRILPITFEIKNTDYNIVHLFLNKNEYTRFINNRKEVVKPLSVKVNYNKNIEINYEIYLDYDLSEIQLVAFKKNTDEFIISPELKVIYFDQEKYRNERKLLIVDLSAQKYQEKKWKTINEKIGVNKFVELMKYQQNKLFKDVSVKSFNENVSDSEIVHYLDSITIKLSNNDNVILLLNGIVLQDEQSGKYYYLLPKANLKSVEGSLLSIEFLLKFLLKTRSTAGMFINLSMRPDKIPPGFRLIDDEQLNSFVDKYLNTQKEIFYMSINNVQPVSISDMLANALHPDNDVDKNGIIDLSEISGFLNHLAKIQVIYRSNFIPFYSK